MLDVEEEQQIFNFKSEKIKTNRATAELEAALDVPADS